MKKRNFAEIYSKIYRACKKVEIKRKKIIITNILLTISPVFLFYYVLLRHTEVFRDDSKGRIFGVVLVIYIIAVLIYTTKSLNRYKASYKKQIIEKIIKVYNEDYYYNEDEGLAFSDYNKSKFDTKYDRILSEDYITGELEKDVEFEMSEITTQVEHEYTDSDGRRQVEYNTTFCGLYGIININVPTTVNFLITENSSADRYLAERIEMESAEFEKYYDVYSSTGSSSDKISALEIITPEIIEELIKIRNNFKMPMRIRVYNDKIFFRIGLGDILEAPKYRKGFDVQVIQDYFNIIDTPRRLYEVFIDSILTMHGDYDARIKRNISKMPEEVREEYIQRKNKEEEATYFSHK